MRLAVAPARRVERDIVGIFAERYRQCDLEVVGVRLEFGGRRRVRVEPKTAGRRGAADSARAYNPLLVVAVAHHVYPASIGIVFKTVDDEYAAADRRLRNQPLACSAAERERTGEDELSACTNGVDHVLSPGRRRPRAVLRYGDGRVRADRDFRHVAEGRRLHIVVREGDAVAAHRDRAECGVDVPVHRRRSRKEAEVQIVARDRNLAVFPVLGVVEVAARA